MKTYFLRTLVERMERLLGVRLDYLREITRSAPGALLPLGLSMPLGAYGRSVPASVLHMARLGATQSQDCGECLQIAVNVAIRDGVGPDTLRAAVEGRSFDLPEAETATLDFDAKVGTGLDPLEAREMLRGMYGDRGVVELSFAAASAHLFPAIKRGMGYARACRVDGVQYLGASAGT